MSTIRTAIFAGAYELWLSTVDPNGQISPLQLGATCINKTNGHLYQCTALPSTWTDYDPSAGAAGWIKVGTVVQLAVPTDTVAVGTAAMLGGEKMRVVQDDAVNNAVTNVLLVEHTTSGVVANGLGAGVAFVAENSAGVSKNLGGVQGFYTDVTSTSEDSALRFLTGAAGAAPTARWTMGAVVGSPGDWSPATDNAYAVGTSLLRLAGVVSTQFRAYVAAGDANSSASMTSSGFALGIGGGNLQDWSLAHSAAGASKRADMGLGNVLGCWGNGGAFVGRTTDTDVNALFSLDTGAAGNGGRLQLGQGGGVALAWALTASPTVTTRANIGSGVAIDAVGANAAFEVRGLDADVNPTVQIIGNGIAMGQGAATALGSRLQSTAAKTMTFDDATGGATATLNALGTLSHTAVVGGTAEVVGGRALASTADSAPVTGAGPNAYNVNCVVPGNTLTQGKTVRIHGCVRSTGLNAADTTTITVTIGGTTYLTSSVDVAAVGDVCVFDLVLTARAAPSGASSVTGSGNIQWSTAAAPRVVGHNTVNLATNGNLTIAVACAYSTGNAGNNSVLESLVVDYV